MRHFPTDSISRLAARLTAPALIALGLIMLLARVASPALPAATAFALIALGVSIVTVSRFSHRAVLVSHLFAYASLYLLVVGAICDSSTRELGSELSIPQIADLGLGTGIMAFVVQMCIAAIADDHDATTR